MHAHRIEVTDGAAAVLLMRRSVADKLGMPVIAALRASALCGVPPDVMGIGPAFAIPEVLRKASLSVNDIDVYEVNEAFASQAEYTAWKIGTPNIMLSDTRTILKNIVSFRHKRSLWETGVCF